MQAMKETLKKFISADTNFIIPVYQRNYDWKKENCKQLLLDIKQNINKELSHFIGTFCTKNESRYNIIIIDGQQRLTSLMLLCKALYDNCKNDKIRRKIKQNYLIDMDDDSELKIKLKPIKKDEPIYQKLITNDFDEDIFNEQEKKSNIYKNYIFFYENIKNILEEYEPENILETIDNSELVEIQLESENPQLIFESLNSTGLDLTTTDLIRNYLLMPLDSNTQENFYKKYWLEIEEMLELANIENFIKYYLILKRKSAYIQFEDKNQKISINQLYYVFKKEISRNATKEEIESLLIDMKKFANYYQKFIDSSKESNKLIKKKFEDIFERLDEKDGAILFLYLYDKLKQEKISEEIFQELLDISII